MTHIEATRLLDAVKQALEAFENAGQGKSDVANNLRQTIAEAEKQERNFCERCGKRLGNGIHTCTPPAEKQEPVADFEVVSYSTGYRNHNDPSAGHGFAVMKGLRCPKCKHEFTPASWYGTAECPECGYNHPQPKAEQEPVACALCGEDEAFTGSCGGGRSNPEALCYTHPQPKRERVLFPTMLRKMWSGSEVQAWLDENVNDIKGEA